jgi:ATP-binding cassette subfamily F protein 3
MGSQAQDFAETMDPARTVLETARAAAPQVPEREIRGLLGGFFFSGDAVDKKVAVLSGGEKMRLAFARMLLNPPNVLLLDEPTTHLDIASREALENALADYAGTVCLVSHDIEFTRHVAQGIIAMSPAGIRRFPGGYDYYHEKMEAEERSRKVSPGTREARPGSPDPDVDSGADKKSLRRERAQRREEVNQRRRPFEKLVKDSEKRLSDLEREQDVLTGELMKPHENTDYAKLNRRLSEIQAALADTVERWERASRELENLPLE